MTGINMFDDHEDEVSKETLASHEYINHLLMLEEWKDTEWLPEDFKNEHKYF